MVTVLYALKDRVCVGTAETFHVIKLPVVDVWSLTCLTVSRLGACKGAFGFAAARDDGVVCGYGGSQ